MDHGSQLQAESPKLVLSQKEGQQDANHQEAGAFSPNGSFSASIRVERKAPEVLVHARNRACDFCDRVVGPRARVDVLALTGRRSWFRGRPTWQRK